MADGDGAAQPAGREHQLAVAARVAVLDAQLRAVVAPRRDLPHREQVDAGHLQHRRGNHPAVPGIPAQHVDRGHGRLLHARRPQPVDAAAMLGQVPDGEDVRVGGQQPVVHDHPAAHGEPGRGGQGGVGLDARRHQAQVGLEHLAVEQLDAPDPLGAEEPPRLRPGDDGDPQVAQHLPEERAAGLVELAGERPGRAVHDERADVDRAQAGGGLQPQQPAADDDGGAAALAPDMLLDGDRVVDRAQDEAAGEAEAVDRRDAGAGARRQDEAVVGERGALVRVHAARAGVDRPGGHTARVVDAPAAGPVLRQQIEAGDRAGFGHEPVDDHPVVEVVRLGAEDGDLDGGVELAQLHGGHAGDAGPDDHHAPDVGGAGAGGRGRPARAGRRTGGGRSLRL